MRVFVWVMTTAIALALAVLPASARKMKTFQVAGWDIAVIADDNSGAFRSCIASGTYKSGISLYFYINSQYQWQFGLEGSRIRVVKDRHYDISLRIDNGYTRHFDAVAFDKDMVSVGLTGNAPLFQEMRLGQTLYVRVAGQSAGFNLTGTARMMLGLLDCVENNGYLPTAPQISRGTPPPSATPAKTDAPDTPARGTVSTGSGFFVDARGTGLTNAHVVAGCKSATIVGYGPARIAARDTTNDLALVQLTPSAPTPVAKMRRRPLQLGETVYAMGFPLAGQLDNGLNFTSGLVSSLAGMGNDARLLQFTAPIQPGNSGGPIVDNAGLVIGVIQSKLSEIAALKESGSLPQNINFGIKTDLAANFVRANGAMPLDADSGPPREATAIAQEGRGFTFQIRCVVE